MSKKKIKRSKPKSEKLSEMEQKVATLILQGKDVEEIMEELGLGIAETTQFMANLYKKIGGN